MSVVAGVDLGGTKLLALTLGARGETRTSVLQSTAVAAGPARVLVQLGEAVAAALGGELPAAIGVGVPGQVDPDTGVCWFSPNLHWREVPVAASLKQRFDVPVVVVNDVHAAAVAEHRRGAGRGYRHLVVVTVGTGIGGALVLDGALYRGAGGVAGELGHFTVDPQGYACNCGNVGCLETVAAGPAVARSAREAATTGSLLWGQHRLDARAVFAAARQGDECALAVVSAAAAQLGTVLAGVVNLLNPELVVIGGGVAGAGELLLGPVRAEIRRRSLPRAAATVEVVPARLGPEAGALGAALLAQELVSP